MFLITALPSDTRAIAHSAYNHLLRSRNSLYTRFVERHREWLQTELPPERLCASSRRSELSAPYGHICTGTVIFVKQCIVLQTLADYDVIESTVRNLHLILTTVMFLETSGTAPRNFSYGKFLVLCLITLTITNFCISFSTWCSGVILEERKTNCMACHFGWHSKALLSHRHIGEFSISASLIFNDSADILSSSKPSHRMSGLSHIILPFSMLCRNGNDLDSAMLQWKLSTWHMFSPKCTEVT